MTVINSPKLAVSDDDDLAGEAPVRAAGGRKTLLASLKEELSIPPVFDEFATIKIPGKPKITLKISTKLPLSRLTAIRKKHTNKKTGEVDIAEMNITLISALTECLQFDGEDVLDDAGNYIDFHHPEMREEANALDVAGTVRYLIPRDPDLLSIGAEILDACGYGEQENDDEELDPLD